jgi:dihydroflavonol-4-reductase
LKKAFLTGGTGFVGANLARVLLAEGWSVKALVRASSDTRNLDGLPIERVEGDLLSEGLAASMQDCDAVFHAAAHYSLWRREKQTLYRVNVLGTINLLEAARTAGVPRFVHTSSVGAIPPIHGGVADESRAGRLSALIGPYKRSKFLAEAAARRAAESGQDVVIVNPATPIGAWDRKPTPTGDMLVRFLTGRMPVMVETGLNFVDVLDVARGHLLAYERGVAGERYILGAENLTLRELLSRVGRLAGRNVSQRTVPSWIPLGVAFIDEVVLGAFGKPPSVPLDGVRMSTEFMYYDSSKARNQLGYDPGSLSGALDRALAWFQDNGYLS